MSTQEWVPGRVPVKAQVEARIRGGGGESGRGCAQAHRQGVGWGRGEDRGQGGDRRVSRAPDLGESRDRHLSPDVSPGEGSAQGCDQRASRSRSGDRGGSEFRGRVGGSRSQAVGRRGEQVAAEYLRRRGYRVLDRNWRSTDSAVPGELDLVLRHRGTLVICEVKARTGNHLAHPAEAVTAAKAARLRRLATVWLRDRGRRRVAAHVPKLARLLNSPPIPHLPAAAVRIDVVAVRLAPREPFAIMAVDHLIGVV